MLVMDWQNLHFSIIMPITMLSIGSAVCEVSPLIKVLLPWHWLPSNQTTSRTARLAWEGMARCQVSVPVVYGQTPDCEDSWSRLCLEYLTDVPYSNIDCTCTYFAVHWWVKSNSFIKLLKRAENKVYYMYNGFYPCFVVVRPCYIADRPYKRVQTQPVTSSWTKVWIAVVINSLCF